MAIKTVFSERKAALQELEANAERAAALAKEIDDQRGDLARFQKRHDRFAAFGDKPLEIPNSSFDQRYGCVIEWEPLRSQKTGKALAAEVAVSIKHLEAEIAKREKEIEELLLRT